jgi:ADP-ribose pyrophosphatase YjhB (NUDIX family)
MAKPVLQAGGIVLRQRGAHLSVLLVRAKSDPSIWIFPKGHIERGESAKEAAVRETREEAGVRGVAVRRVGQPVEFHNGRALVRVRYFLIRPLSESSKTDGRAKRWFPIAKGIAAVSFKEDRALLKLAAARHRAARRTTAVRSIKRTSRPGKRRRS